MNQEIHGPHERASRRPLGATGSRQRFGVRRLAAALADRAAEHSNFILVERSEERQRTGAPQDALRGSSFHSRPILLLSLLCFLFSAVLALAQSPFTVVDRLGTNSLSTDDHPGGLITHYAHGTGSELWGACGSVWTQPFAGTLAEVAFVGFARVVNPTNGMYLDPVTNLSAFTLNLHFWTNGVAGFLAATNPAHGDVVIPLGAGPSAPALFGVTRMTNTVVNSTNLYVSVLPTFRYTTNLAALNLRLEAGREYVLAWAFEGVGGNVVVRQSTASTTGTPDVFASFAATRGLQKGPTTNVFNQPQFATSITALPDEQVRLGIAHRENTVDLWWSALTGESELWTTTNLTEGPWWLWPQPLTTNFLSITNPAGQQFFRLKPDVERVRPWRGRSDN